jgi:hypothetical protein
MWCNPKLLSLNLPFSLYVTSILFSNFDRSFARKIWLSVTITKKSLKKCPLKKQIWEEGVAPSSSLFHFLLPTLIFILLFWCFLLFLGILRPYQHFWPLLYTSVHLPQYCAVYLLPSHCWCLLVVFLFWIRVFFSLNLPS